MKRKKEKPRDVRLAIRNGHRTEARRMGAHWFVGGDFVQAHDQVLIACFHNDRENGQRWSWMALKGATLKFQDYMTDADIAEQAEITARQERIAA